MANIAVNLTIPRREITAVVNQRAVMVAVARTTRQITAVLNQRVVTVTVARTTKQITAVVNQQAVTVTVSRITRQITAQIRMGRDGAPGPAGPIGPAGASGISGIAVPFMAAELVAGILTINHALGERFVDVVVWDNSGQRIRPSRVVAVDSATLTVDLAVFTIVGTWYHKVYP